MRRLVRFLLFPVPYLLFPLMALYVIFVQPFTITIPAAKQLRQAYPQLRSRPLWRCVLRGMHYHFKWLIDATRQWPSTWKRSLN